MKNYPLEIQEIHCDWCVMAYYTKGHHGFGAVRAAVLDHDGEMEGLEMEPFYAWVRCAQCNWGNDFNCHIIDGTPGVGGTFPVTMVPATPGERIGYTEYERMPDAEVGTG